MMKCFPRYMFGVLAVCLLSVTQTASAQNATTPGSLSSPFPTIQHLAVTWQISGDNNNNATATVRFREVGTSRWRDGLPLRRVPAGSNESFSWQNKLSGSLFGLAADTNYEIEVQLSDPDGGSAMETIMARTRPVPVAASNGRMVNVTPATLAAAISNAQNGDIIILANGNYSSFSYSGNGALGQPIVFRGESRDGVRVAGGIDLTGSSHIFLETLTVAGGRVKLNDTEGNVVRGCKIESSASSGAGDGIVAWLPSVNGYIADNEVIGTTSWNEAALGVSGDNLGEGILVSGPGNVVEYNRVSNYRDCLSLVEDTSGSNQQSIDFIGNDLSICADDAIEADFSEGNVRVIGNRMRDSFIALSSQPSLGGPTYFIRNVLFNTLYNNFKLNRGSIGDVILHNTSVKGGDAFGVYAGRTISRAYMRNNLFIGGGGSRSFNGFNNGSGRVMQVADADDTCDFDYDGFASVGTNTFRGRVGSTTFSSLAELRSMTTETNASEVDLATFVGSVPFPPDYFGEAPVPNMQLQAGGTAVDKGVELPNINNGYGGSAPDLGAYESGMTLPKYGPRTGGAECGNRAVEGAEECDDGNLRDNDGCSSSCVVENGGTPDAGVPDAGVPDAMIPDATIPDATIPDATIPDAMIPDAVIPDAIIPDASIVDGEVIVPDAMIPDAVIPDAVVPDAIVPDAIVPDAIVADAVVADAVTTDASEDGSPGAGLSGSCACTVMSAESIPGTLLLVFILGVLTVRRRH